jgi:hypothetical protein
MAGHNAELTHLKNNDGTKTIVYPPTEQHTQLVRYDPPAHFINKKSIVFLSVR